MNSKVISPMPLGTGAIVVHHMLEDRLDNYRVIPYSPKATYFPPCLRWCVPRPRADIVHTTPDHAPLLYQAGVPLVVTYHNFVVDSYMRPYSTIAQRIHYSTDLRFFLRRSLKLADRVTAVSKFTADLIRSELGFEGEVKVIPNGVETERFRLVKGSHVRSKPRVLFSGNPSVRKGSQWLPDIARKLRGKATILATADRGSPWAARFRGAGIEVLDKIPFSAMPELYRSVDALLLPSVREGDCLAVLEAMSSGLPVIASNCSGLADRVHHRDGGYICETGNVEQFVKAIEHIADPQLRRTMGEYNRQRAVQEFSWQRMVASYRKIFDEISAR